MFIYIYVVIPVRCVGIIVVNGISSNFPHHRKHRVGCGPSAGEILKMLMYMWAEVAQTGLKYLCCIPPKSNNLQNRSLLCAGKCLKALRLGFLGPWNPCIVGTIVMPLIIIMSIVSNAAS